MDGQLICVCLVFVFAVGVNGMGHLEVKSIKDGGPNTTAKYFKDMNINGKMEKCGEAVTASGKTFDVVIDLRIRDFLVVKKGETAENTYPGILCYEDNPWLIVVTTGSSSMVALSTEKTEEPKDESKDE